VTLSRLHSVAFSVPKLGRGQEENEDSVALDPLAGRFAVADGASASARPELWSRLLVDAFVRERIDPLAADVLPRLRDRWNSMAGAADLPWYAQAKLQQGAASTFLSLYLDTRSLRYHAASLGDSCLFHVRGDRALMIGPIEHSDAFNNYPQLVSSRADAPYRKAAVFMGEYLPGDRFLLATDAIARFLLAAHERHQRVPVRTLARGREEFARGVTRYRLRGQIANDDTTLCVVWA